MYVNLLINYQLTSKLLDSIIQNGIKIYEFQVQKYAFFQTNILWKYFTFQGQLGTPSKYNLIFFILIVIIFNKKLKNYHKIDITNQ